MVTTTTRSLLEGTFIPNAEAAIFTAEAKTRIDRINSSAALGADVTLRIVPSGATASARYDSKKKTFLAGDTYQWPELVGHTLEAGSFISAVSTVVNAVNIRISGTTIT
jgi:hypothetical protein